MSDEYICSICGHRAGDHAVSNRCLAINCDCKDDPYIDQLDTLRKQLAIAVEAIKRAREHYYEDGTDGGYYILKDALAEIERFGGKND